MFITAILFVGFIFLLVVYFGTLKSRYNYFVRRNIPGPPPQFFFGHLLKLWKAPLSFLQIQDWTRRYGSIYGLFEGTHPIYIVSDVDFLQEVYIKQFSSFHSRRTNFLSRIHNSNGAHLFSAHADQWRRQRHVINPTFSRAKLKIMTPLMNGCVQSMMIKVDEMNDCEFNIYALYKRLTMDVICK
jgi:cytochrome P450 family 13